MWDLFTIVANNNRKALEWMMEGQRISTADLQQPDSLPFQALVEKLNMGPPLIEELVNGFTDIDTLQQFLTLVRNFLPDHEEEIMFGGPRNNRVLRFCNVFADKFFPLPPWASNMALSDFSCYMPLEMKGMSYEAYHDLNMRPGYLMLLALVEYPYEGDERDEEERAWRTGNKPRMTPFGQEVWAYEVGADIPEEESEGKTLMEIFADGARVPLLDKVQRMIGEDSVIRIPRDGWTPEELHKMTDGTPYDGVGDFASWATQSTATVALDTNYSDVEYVEGNGEPLFKWTWFNINTMTEEWPRVKQIREKIDKVVEWLEADPRSRFEELVDFLLKAAPLLPIEKIPRSYDPTEFWCPLDQVSDYMEMDEIEAELGGSGINGYEDTEEEDGRTITFTDESGTRQITAGQFISGRY